MTEVIITERNASGSCGVPSPQLGVLELELGFD